MKKQQGLTLIEIMITMVIIGILAAIAWPLFEQQSMKNRRTDGIRSLINDSNQLESCFTDKADYTGCITFPHDSEKAFYEITISNLAAETYTLTATPKTSTAQAADSDCTTLTLNHLGVKGSTGSAAKKRCWAE